MKRLIVLSKESTDRRAKFFEYAFGGYEGFVCIARIHPESGHFAEQFFQWPKEAELLHRHLEQYLTHNLYFCPHLFRERSRTKAAVSITPSLWADLDECSPDELLVKPTFVLETSPDRFQALWLLDGDLAPVDAEDFSRRIAYRHSDAGADRSGWDLTQLLRVPLTFNHKYRSRGSSPVVKIIEVNPTSYTLDDFIEYPVPEFEAHTAIPLPDPEQIPDADDTLSKYKNDLHPQFWYLYGQEPKDDWSKALWNLQMLAFEAGLSREEVYSIARSAHCNKYQRDGKSDKLLWKEVCRAWGMFESKNEVVPISIYSMPDLLTEGDREACEQTPTIVEDYVEWAKTTGDAAWQYHQAGAFITLSSLLAGNIKLPTSFGTVVPNIWAMILADTTLTRKTTAMDLTMDMIADIDADAVLATDGSIEGLFTSLSTRPGRPSIFLRDEFSGLLEAITKKDYYAGMAETLTKLYDGKFQKRILRKEIIEVRDPVLILFAGGIKTRILQLLTYEHVASGFLPRFIFISAESDVSKLRPLGPPTEENIGERNHLIDRFSALSNHYAVQRTVLVGRTKIDDKREWLASMTPDAWGLYNKLENVMVGSALRTPQEDLLTPAFDRLSKSGLKLAVLIAAARKRDERIVVEEEDIIRAFYYIEQWRPHTMEVLRNIGRTAHERLVEIIFGAIVRDPGVLRSKIMQAYHLTARDADAIFNTLDQRGMISRAKSGRSEKLTPVGLL